MWTCRTGILLEKSGRGDKLLCLSSSARSNLMILYHNRGFTPTITVRLTQPALFELVHADALEMYTSDHVTYP